MSTFGSSCSTQTGHLCKVGRAGQFEANDSSRWDCRFGIVRGPTAGSGTRYFLVADLVDGNRSTFAQFGSTPLEVSFTVGGRRGMSNDSQRESAPASGLWVKRLLKVAVSAAILGLLAMKTDWNHVTAAVRDLRWSYRFGRVRRACSPRRLSVRLRWQWIARPLGFDGPLLPYVGIVFRRHVL